MTDAVAPPRVPTPRSLVLDLLSTLRRGSMPVRALVDAAALFGIAENSLRVSLARLHRAGLVVRDGRGRYALGPAASDVNRQVTSWRRRPARRRAWARAANGAPRWVGVFGAAADATATPRAARSERALELLGFRSLAPGLAVRPDNLAGSVAALRDELAALGLAPGAIVATLGELDAATAARACALWSAEALAASADALCADLAASRARLARLAPRDAMVESFALGGRAIRRIVLDPLLPAELVDERPLSALVDAARDYDAAGRACWAAFLAEHGVAHRAAPADVRVGDAAAALARNTPSHAVRAGRAAANAEPSTAGGAPS
ncbi:MAG: hypothetical protein R3E88_04760 [Myxococcota bacterium]